MTKRFKAIVSILSVVMLVGLVTAACAAPAVEPTKAPAPAPTKAPAPATEPTKAPAPAATKPPAAEPTKAPAAAAPAQPAAQAPATPKRDADLYGLTPSAPKKPYRLGVTVPHYRDPYWVAVVYGEVDEAERWGAKVDGVFEAGSYTDLAKQIRQMEDLIERKVDAILFSPVDYEGTAAVVEQAVKAGITVINVVNLTKSDKIALAVSNYDPDIGASAADWIGKKLNGKGKVVLFSGPAGATWSVGRANGFKDKMKAQYPGIQILAEKWTNVDRAEAQKVMEDWVQAFPEIDGVFAVADLMGQGASIVLKQAGRKEKTLVTVAGMNEDSFRMVKEGGLDLALPDLGVVGGRWGVQLAFKVLNGEAVDVKQKGSLELPKKVMYLDNPTYTRDNIDKANTTLIWNPPGWVPPR